MFTKSILLALGAASLAQAVAIDAPELFKRQNPPGYPCNRDYCLRSMVATQTSTQLSRAIADCTSYFWATETPATFTQTDIASATQVDTAFVTTTSVSSFVPPQNLKREAGTIPAYAAACSGFSRYSSACSCLGVTSSTVTLPTPSTTVTQTNTETTTTTIAIATVTPITFKIRRYTPGTSNNQYLQVDADSGNLFYYNSVAATATWFTLDPTTGFLYLGTQVAGSKVAYGITNQTTRFVTFASAPANAAWYPFTCQVATTGNGALTCTLAGDATGQFGFSASTLNGDATRLITQAAAISGIQVYLKAVH